MTRATHQNRLQCVVFRIGIVRHHARRGDIQRAVLCDGVRVGVGRGRLIRRHGNVRSTQFGDPGRAGIIEDDGEPPARDAAVQVIGCVLHRRCADTAKQHNPRCTVVEPKDQLLLCGSANR